MGLLEVKFMFNRFWQKGTGDCQDFQEDAGELKEAETMCSQMEQWNGSAKEELAIWKKDTLEMEISL